ncbi:MAG TPA: twin-arginine translocation signal domain-containing protein, partial [Tepidiformaceae bacterium]|nr:twin-arginine translocation signal domain-containing protein [Tepidiformaceae bacterium]
MEDNYWQRHWTLRRSRRRFLGGAAAVGAGATGIVLVGCSSSSKKSNTPAATKPAGSSTAGASSTASGSSTASAGTPKPGGTFQNVTTGDPPTLHPYKNLSFTVKGFACYVYSRLMKYDTQPGKDPALITPTGDLADKIESSPDGTQWTVTLRDNIFFQNIPPVSG